MIIKIHPFSHEIQLPEAVVLEVFGLKKVEFQYLFCENLSEAPLIEGFHGRLQPRFLS